MSFRVLSLRSYLMLCLLAIVGYSAQASSSPAASQRVIVKLRSTFAKTVESSLPTTSMTLVRGNSSTPVRTFMDRHAVARLKPVYPQIVRAKKLGLTDLQIATGIRNRFPARAGRLRGNFQPPEISRTYIVEFDTGDLNQKVDELKRDPAVEYAEPDHLASTTFIPNDPYYSSYGTWGQAYDDLWGVKKISAASAWDTTAGAGITVAIVDTGIDYNHPDIASNIWTNKKEIAGDGVDDDNNGYVDDTIGWDFIGSTYRNPTQSNNPIDHFGHGTHVAGTIAAVGNNGTGVIGVAWQSHVMALKGLDDSGYGLDSTLGPAIIYAANNGAEIISNSWSGQGSSQTIADAVSYAYNLGVVIVVAAGNNNDDARNYYPANLPQVITVAATDHSDYIAYFSNWGSKIDVAAPGVDILSLRAAGTSMGTPVDAYYTRADGTSMATPHVSGLAALVLGAHPSFSNEDVRQVIRNSATDLSTAGFDLTYGYGRINTSSAVAIGYPLESKILSPIDGTHLQGPTTISGVARGSTFAQYTLEYGAGNLPTSWTTIQTGVSPVGGGALGVFDSSTLPDGKYTIRLTTQDFGGSPYRDRVELIVDYVAIAAPAPPVVPVTAAEYKPGAPISIQGTATGPSFADFRMDWAEGVNPSSGWSTSGMTLSNGGTSPISNGLLATWNTAAITTADYYTIRLSVDNAGLTSQAMTIVYLEPSLLTTGWPHWLNQAPYVSSGVIPAMDSSGLWHLTLQNPRYGNTTVPGQFWNFSADGLAQHVTQLNYANNFNPAAGDLNGVPGDEVVAGDNNWLYEFNLDNNFSEFYPGGLNANFQTSQVVLEDLDGDSQFETIVLGRDGTNETAHVFAWRRDGTQLNSNFPLLIQDQNLNLSYASGPRVLVADINGDGKREIIVQEGVSSSTFALHLFANDGTLLTWSAPVFNGYPDQMGSADLDHNGTLDVVLICLCNSHKELHVLQPDGTERAGWPIVLADTSWSHFAVGDLNRDGTEEIVVSNNGAIYVLEPNGTSYSAAWPLMGGGFTTFGPVVLADVDGDGFPEIITTQNQIFSSSNPLLLADVSNAASGATHVTIDRQLQPDGTITIQTHPDASAQAYSSNPYYQPKLMAMHPDRTVVRSWNLLGANGNQPSYGAVLTIGDFNQDGITDIAASYLTISGGTISGYLNEGSVTVLTTGAPFNPAVNDWPMIYQNPRNTATMIRDHTPPSVSIVSPMAGSFVNGVISVTATTSDNLGVSRVQFLLDGAILGTVDTTAPFGVSWDTSTASRGTHTLAAQAWDAAGNLATSSAVSVTVASPPTAVVSPIGYDPGQVAIGTTVSGMLVTVTNSGGGLPLHISSTTITGDADFYIATNNCLAGPIAQGASCTLQVSFAPKSIGAGSATLTINSDALNSPGTVSLTGTGINNAPIAVVSPISYEAGQVVIATTLSGMAVTVTNSGGGLPLHISSTTLTGDTDFYIASNNCLAAPIAQGASCSLQVSFAPKSIGRGSATLTINGDAQNSTATVSFTGTGVNNAPTFSPMSLAFGNIYVGKSSGSKAVKVTANGPNAMSISGITMSSGFTQTNNCPASLSKGASCNINVIFAPAAAGVFSGTLTLSDNGQGNPQTIPLTGTGLDYSISASPTSASVTAGAKATYTVTLVPLGGAYGSNVSLSCSGLPKGGKCSFSPSSISLGSNTANSTLTVSTTAGGGGTPIGSYTLTINASGNNSHATIVTLVVN